MKIVVYAAMLVLWVSPSAALTGSDPQRPEPSVMDRLQLLSQSYSCTPRRYCSRSISSCAAARWYFQNCSWGGALDGDNDGIPCENLC